MAAETVVLTCLRLFLVEISSDSILDRCIGDVLCAFAHLCGYRSSMMCDHAASRGNVPRMWCLYLIVLCVILYHVALLSVLVQRCS